MAQQVAHILGKNEVSGSIPLISTIGDGMKMFEGVVREADGNEKKVRVMANDAYEARKLLQQWHGVRQVPYLPKIVPS